MVVVVVVMMMMIKEEKILPKCRLFGWQFSETILTSFCLFTFNLNYTCILTLSPYTVRLIAFYDITLTTAVKLNVLAVVLLMNFEGNTTVTICGSVSRGSSKLETFLEHHCETKKSIKLTILSFN